MKDKNYMMISIRGISLLLESDNQTILSEIKKIHSNFIFDNSEYSIKIELKFPYNNNKYNNNFNHHKLKSDNKEELISIISNGFPWKSGTTNKTIANLSSDSIILSDEISLVKIVEGECGLFGTPFGLETALSSKNNHPPLKNIFLPKKNNENYIMHSKPNKTLEHLIPNVLFFLDNGKFKMKLFNCCFDIVNSIPADELHLLPKPSFWSVINC